MMIIPHDFPDDLIDYIYSFIIYNKKKELLDEIILFKITKKLFINKYIKNYNNYNDYMLTISVNIRKLIVSNDNLSFKIPQIILNKYSDVKYSIQNKELLVNLFLVKNLKKIYNILKN